MESLIAESVFSFVAVSGSRPEVVTRWPGPWRGAESSSAAGMMMMATRKKKRRQEEEQEEEQVFDAVVCGGTLGVFLATALALKGMKVAIVERGPLRGVPYLPYLPLLSFSCTNFGFPFSCS